MTISASHVTAHPIPVHRHWHAVTAGVASVFRSIAHGLTSAATVGVAAPRDYRPARYAFLERAEMARQMEHL